MKGPYSVAEVNSIIASVSPGAYILSRDGQHAHYVGRADADVGRRISQSVNEGYGYRYFWFEYASSRMRAYQLECELYHKFNPPDNTNHPAVPANAFWRCPIRGCPWS